MGSRNRKDLKARLGCADLDRINRDLFVQDYRQVQPRILVPTNARLVREPPKGQPASPHRYPRIVWARDAMLGTVDDASNKIEWTQGGFRGRVVPPGESVIHEFIGLDRASPERVLAFVGKWGLLQVCPHGKPWGHYPRRCLPLADNYLSPMNDVGEETAWEPLEPYYRYSRQLGALLRIAADVTEGKRGAREDWQALQEGEPDKNWPFVPVPPEWRNQRDVWAPKQLTGLTPDKARAYLANALNNWLGYGFAHATPVPADGRINLTLAVSGLAGLLATDLAKLLTSRVGIYRCDCCHNGYEPPSGRRPRRDRARYCTKCSRDARLAAKRDYWHRRHPPKGATTPRERHAGAVLSLIQAP